MIEVGEYVRTKKKGIFKVLSIRKTPYGHYCGTVDNDNIRTFTIGKGGNAEIKNDIIKHSKNIIDLIEYGDLVKFKGWGETKGIDVIDMRTNKKINLVFPDAEFCDGWSDNCMIYDLDYLIEKNQSNKIDWVLTHEQIKNNCYRLEENK